MASLLVHSTYIFGEGSSSRSGRSSTWRRPAWWRPRAALARKRSSRSSDGSNIRILKYALRLAIKTEY